MRNNPLANFALTLILLTIMLMHAACSEASPLEKEVEDAVPIEQEAIRIVGDSISSDEADVEFRTVLLDGGVGLTSSIGGVYWYKEGVAYYAHYQAMWDSPGIPRAPTDITYIDILNAIDLAANSENMASPDSKAFTEFINETKFGLTLKERIELHQILQASGFMAMEEAERIAPVARVGEVRNLEVDKELTKKYRAEIFQKYGVKESDLVFPLRTYVELTTYDALNRSEFARKISTEWMYNIGCKYLSGGWESARFVGVYINKNVPLGMALVERAAEQGYHRAQSLLATEYGAGKAVYPTTKLYSDVRVDPEKSFRWVKVLAEQGDALWGIRMGSAYYFGNGVPRDYVQAYAWLSRSISTFGSGRREVEEYLRELETKMSPEHIREAQLLSASIHERIQANYSESGIAKVKKE